MPFYLDRVKNTKGSHLHEFLDGMKGAGNLGLTLAIPAGILTGLSHLAFDTPKSNIRASLMLLASGFAVRQVSSIVQMFTNEATFPRLKIHFTGVALGAGLVLWGAGQLSDQFDPAASCKTTPDHSMVQFIPVDAASQAVTEPASIPVWKNSGTVVAARHCYPESQKPRFTIN